MDKGYYEQCCGVCGSEITNSERLPVREMMHGTRKVFHYVTCESCGCVQLIDIPQNLETLYLDYYGRVRTNRRGLPYRIRRWSFNTAINAKWNPIGAFYNRFFGTATAKILGKNIPRDASILDVGCANGLLLLLMKDAGFQNLKGCDPYIAASLHYENGVIVKKQALDDETGFFDVIMAHHVLEHVPNQHEFLVQILEHLKPSGKALIRIPTCSSWAFENYGSDWYQIDAPRHLFIHSRQSILQLLESIGFVNVSVQDDSTIWQILSSELYIQNVPFMNHTHWLIKNLPAILLTRRLHQLTKRVEQLNLEARGDQICIIAERR